MKKDMEMKMQKKKKVKQNMEFVFYKLHWKQATELSYPKRLS